METMKLRARVGEDGLLKLELPTSGLANRDLEVVIVMQPLEEAVDEYGWPLGFFDRTYGALADDPIERPPELAPDVRDEIE
ncbi:MAG: hypothetical protein JNJ61_04170 [Anaerolineae bacterium]|nr:hypothetical protein [Anaerolineae bacterium]